MNVLMKTKMSSTPIPMMTKKETTLSRPNVLIPEKGEERRRREREREKERSREKKRHRKRERGREREGERER